MASKKKSAIQARQGHPTGIIDDVARPIVQKAAKVVMSRAASKSPASNVRAKVYYAARDIERKVAEKRSASYRNKAEKLYQKELEMFNAGKPTSARKVTRSANKRRVLGEKGVSVETQGTWQSPRQAAKFARKSNRAQLRATERIKAYPEKPSRKIKPPKRVK